MLSADDRRVGLQLDCQDIKVEVEMPALSQEYVWEYVSSIHSTALQSISRQSRRASFFFHFPTDEPGLLQAEFDYLFFTPTPRAEKLCYPVNFAAKSPHESGKLKASVNAYELILLPHVTHVASCRISTIFFLL